jgi:cellobiose phosphorylase
MNLVGEKGKGESVWLAFFLYDVLKNFSILAGRRGDKFSPNYAIRRQKSCAKTLKKCLGRPMVSPRVFRQWRTARFRFQSRMSD